MTTTFAAFAIAPFLALAIPPSRVKQCLPAGLALGPHQFAAAGATGQVFVPVAASATSGHCLAGCVAVFAARQP